MFIYGFLSTIESKNPILNLQDLRFMISMFDLDWIHVHDISWVPIHDFHTSFMNLNNMCDKYVIILINPWMYKVINASMILIWFAIHDYDKIHENYNCI